MWKIMNSGLLSQEEIDALLNGVRETPALSESDKDLLGEIGNISMGSASTALSTIIGKMVNITTPRVTLATLNEIKKGFEVPNVALEVEYTEGLHGVNLLLIKITDAVIISDIMMGGDGDKKSETLSELELSAVSEAMNQMIGSASTSLATMFDLPINITPPIAKVWDDETQNLSDNINGDEQIVRISFRLTIDVLVDSEIMMLLPLETAKSIIDRMSGGQSNETEENNEFNFDNELFFDNRKDIPNSDTSYEQYNEMYNTERANSEPPRQKEQPVNVQKAQFAPLTQLSSQEKHNIDLILDVPLEISVVLGRTKKTIKEILELGSGSLVELDKLTEEPVEVLVNGKKVALGEVVVIDENFGVRITSIISNAERVKSLRSR
jgi:flagellar motor switch protein FliN/FliY